MWRLSVLAWAASVVLGCDAGYRIWIPRSESADPLFRFIKHGKAGYIDATGRVVIPPTLPENVATGEFHDGLMEVAVFDGEYVDRTGRLVIKKDLYRGWDFSEGLAVAMRNGEKLWGYINTKGDFAISPRFESSLNDYVYPFSDGLAMIKVHGKFGYIDHTGAFAIPPRFPDGTSFSDGMARVVMEGPCVYFPDGACGAFNPVFVGGKQGTKPPPCKFSYIDKTGRVITEQRFDFARDFSEGLAPVKIGALWGFVDKNGKVVIAPRFEDAQPFSSGLSRVRIGGLYGYVDRSGSVVVAPRHKYAEGFSEEFAVVGDLGGTYWYIDKEGRRKIPGEYDAASPFFKGLAHVRFMSGGEAYIDSSGRIVFRY
ncbi:MAG TPA: WG repeat-containing protein [Bryobacteraceae bacterium]|nr:WG repeat-containing protein [Bryobacteraceae bacterium]